MTQFENSEIMLHFANVMEQDMLLKRAADITDYVNAIGAAIGTDVAATAALGGLAGSGILGHSSIIGALTGAGVAQSAGVGAGALAALSGAIAPVAVVLGLAGVAYAIYEVSKITDDNIDDLISRLDALDPANEQVAGQISKIRERLLSYKEAIGVADMPETPEERIRYNKRKLDAFTNLHKYLSNLVTWFPREIMPRLTDWGRDPEQALNAIKKTLAAMQQSKEKMQRTVKEVTKEAVKEYGQKIGHDLQETGKKVISMYNELTKHYGKAPTFDNDAEKSGYELAKALASGKVNFQQVKQNAQSLIMIHNLFKKALSAAQQKAKSSLSENSKISKRALTLGDGTRVTLRGPRGVSRKERVRRPVSRRSPATTNIQKSLNYLNQAYNTGASKVTVDGIYGPQTQAALETFLNVHPSVSKWANISQTDYKVIANKSDALNAISNKLNAFVEVAKKEESRTSPKERQTGVQYGGGQYDVTEQPHKWNPTGAEILAALNNKFIDNTPARVWLENRGFSRENQIKLVKDVFSGPRGLPPASDWSMPALEDYVRRNYRGFLSRVSPL